jgi:hypothetical protein
MTLELVVGGVLIGLGAAALMDVWSLALRRGFGVTTLDYALLGRWIGHLAHGQVRHQRIGSSEPVRGERAMGWAAHYAIGITFAFVLLAIVGPGWLQAPTLLPPQVVGLVTILAPWLVMQPGMGAGIAGSRTPAPGATRLRNLGTHTVYGAGLYLSALLLALA